MSRRNLTNEEILERLAGGPAKIAEVTAGISVTRLQAPPAANEWSANDVLAHLRSCADVWGGCIERILGEDSPSIRAVNPTTWIERTNYRDLEFRRSLRSFTSQRTALLALLEPLADRAWARQATVTGAGKPSVRTVHFYAQWLATHEGPHIKQIQRAVSA